MKRVRLGMMALVMISLWPAASARAVETVRRISWTDRAGMETTPGVSVKAEGDRLIVENASSSARQVPLVLIGHPGVSADRYAVVGEVTYHGLSGTGYIEMWSFFPDGGRYFSRTLANSGPMARLTGSSGWRGFLLPFTSRSGYYPDRLQLNVFLPSAGTVELRSVRLVQYAPGEAFGAQPGAWLTARQGGLLGGLLGSVLGLLGALVGILGSRGTARGLVLGLMAAAVAFGALLLALGVAAVLARQPYAVYFPLLLAGGLSVILFGGLRPQVKRRYEELEMRRISARDIA